MGDHAGEEPAVKRPTRVRNRVASLLTIGGVVLVLAGYAASSSSALPMGFGVERLGSDRDWLGLQSDSKWATVNGYLDHEKATWVNVHVPWSGLASGSSYAAVHDWATRAQQSNKQFLLTVDYTAPSDLQRGGGCVQPQSRSTDDGNAAIQSMRAAVKGLYQYPGMSGAVWNNVRLEIGSESNFDTDCTLWPVDAQLWWDIVNGLARSANNNGWAPGLGVVSGGVFTRSNTGTGGFGTGNVGATTYLEEGIHNARNFPWEHYDGTNFQAYGVHVGNNSDLQYRTTWSGDDGVRDRINDVRAALVDTSEPNYKEIEVTALIPTQTRPDGTPDEATQNTDTTDVWNNIRTTFATYDRYPVDLVMWNHIVDTNQGFGGTGGDFARAGFMTCDDPSTCATESTYTGKAVYRAAPDWPRWVP